MLKKLTETKKSSKNPLIERSAMGSVLTTCGAPCVIDTENKYQFDVCDPTQL